MNKLKYIMGYSRDTLIGTAITLPMALSMVSADTDLGSSRLDDNGNLIIDGADASGTEGTVSTFNTIMDKLRILIAGVTGVLALVMVLIFTYKAFNLAKSSDNPQERQRAIQGLIFYFIGAACFGAASMFSGLFYNMLN